MILKNVPLLFWSLLFCTLPAISHANIGVPMLTVFALPLLYTLIPVVIIEGLWIKKDLNITLREAFNASFRSNLVSTLIGIPLTWGILAGTQLLTGGGGAYGLNSFWGVFLSVTWQAPWLIPYGSALNWMIPTAALFLLIPFFYVSWRIESFIVEIMLQEKVTRARVKQAMFRANLITYALFACYIVGQTTYFFFSHPKEWQALVKAAKAIGV